jgi:hypothetical protein
MGSIRKVEIESGIMDKIFSKIISGGQTGVDRAALDIALELNIFCGGWCPKGRRSEDGQIPAKYPLQETTSTNYRIRTEKNVTDSDGTLILTDGPPTGGTAFTVRLAKRHKRPYYIVDLAIHNDVNPVLAWLLQNKIQTLNVAGPRESKVPGIHDRAVDFLKKVLNETSDNKQGG